MIQSHMAPSCFDRFPPGIFGSPPRQAGMLTVVFSRKAFSSNKRGIQKLLLACAAYQALLLISFEFYQ